MDWRDRQVARRREKAMAEMINEMRITTHDALRYIQWGHWLPYQQLYPDTYTLLHAARKLCSKGIMRNGSAGIE